MKGLAETKNRLGHHTESGRSSATLLLEVRQGRGVVREHRHHTTTQRRKELSDHKQNRKELPMVDGKSRA